MTPTNPKTLERLKKGAVILGQYWKLEAERCPTGWSLDDCVCEPKKKFCKARMQWLELAIEDGRELDGPFAMALAMTGEEWDMTRVGLKMEHEGVSFSVGTSEECVMSKVDLEKMMKAPQGLSCILRVMKAFPKSSIQAVTEADPLKVPENILKEEPVEA